MCNLPPGLIFTSVENETMLNKPVCGRGVDVVGTTLAVLAAPTLGQSRSADVPWHPLPCRHHHVPPRPPPRTPPPLQSGLPSHNSPSLSPGASRQRVCQRGREPEGRSGDNLFPSAQPPTARPTKFPPLRIKKESVTRAGWYHARDEAIKPLIPEQLCTTPWAALPPIGITRLSQFRHSPHITGSSYPALEFKRKRS